MRNEIAAEKLSGALSLIDDEYIAEAGSHTVTDKDRRPLRFAAVAAAVIAVFVTAVPILIHTGVIKIGSTPATPSADGGIVALKLRIQPMTVSMYWGYGESEYLPFRSINDTRNDTWNDESVPKKKTVTVGGREYNGEYVQTERKLYRTYIGHLYSFVDEDGQNGTFSVNAETGELSTLSYNPTDDSWIGGGMTFEECEKEAARIAGQYIDYRYCESRDASPTAKTKTYEFNFYEADHADPVGVGASVKVSFRDGAFFSFEMHAPFGNGSPDITEAVEALTSGDAQAIVGEKLERIFETEKPLLEGQKIDSYSVISMTAVRLDGGVGRESVGVVYECSVYSVYDSKDKPYKSGYAIEILVKFIDTEESERNDFLSDPDNFTAFAIGKESDYGSQLTDHTDCEYEPWRNVNMKWTDGSAPEKLKLTFDGEEYYGTYSYTTRPLYSPYNVRVYHFASGNDYSGDFYVNERTGELDEIFFIRGGNGAVNSATFESCEKDAVRIAGQYIDKLIFKTKVTAGTNKRYVYSFYTVGNIHDIDYSTSVTVMFNGKGELVRFRKNAPGAIDASDTDDIEALIGSGARAAADKKIKEMFGDTLVSSYVSEQIAVPLGDDGVGVVYTYNVTAGTGTSGSGVQYTENVYVRVLVKIK